jgi:hypothetical protein
LKVKEGMFRYTIYLFTGRESIFEKKMSPGLPGLAKKIEL